jgi:hypothetical protein
MLPGSALPFLDLSDCFRDLAIETGEDVEGESAPANSPTGATWEVSPNAIVNPRLADSANNTYELDIDSSVDRSFDVFCFFEDLHRIQDFLKETWNDYKEYKIDLITAVIITNAAIDIVRRLEESLVEIISTGSDWHDKKSLSYNDLLSMDTEPGTEPLNTDMATTSSEAGCIPHDSFVYRSTARTLSKFAEYFHSGNYEARNSSHLMRQMCPSLCIVKHDLSRQNAPNKITFFY